MNYSKRQTKLETPAFFSFLFLASLRRFVLASSFLLAFGTIQRMNEFLVGEGRETVRLNHISALFDPRASKREGFVNFKITFKKNID